MTAARAVRPLTGADLGDIDEQIAREASGSHVMVILLSFFVATV